MSEEPDPGVLTDSPDDHWTAPWSAEERESFFTAIERNRRASWQVAVAAGFAAVVIAIIVASLMSPLLYGVAGLLLDLINLFTPAPDLLAAAFERIDTIIESLPDDETGATPDFPWMTWLETGVLAALPGLGLMAAALLVLHRAVRGATVHDGRGLRLRAPHDSRLPERRFLNVVSEMSIAALTPVPSVRITHRDMGNAVFLDDAEGKPVIISSMDLVDTLDRNAMQGIAAHLVASLCNGDVRNGHRIAVVTALFGLMSRMATGFTQQGVLSIVGHLAVAALLPTAARARAVLDDLSNPFTAGDEQSGSAPDDGKLTWKHWVWMPISGPIAMSGFFAGIVATFVLSPLLAVVWRRRRLLADATAVRLTRNPDAVARGIEQATAMRRTDPIDPWAAHLAVVQPPAPGKNGKQRSFIDGAVVSYYPDTRKRLEALAAQGANVQLAEAKTMPLHILAMVIPLVAILVLLFLVLFYMLIVVSLMLSMLFTLIPIGLLHAVLR